MDKEKTISVLKQEIGNKNITICYSDDDVIFMTDVGEYDDNATMRLGMNCILVCTSGRSQAAINGQTLFIEKYDLIILPPHTAISDMMFSKDFRCMAFGCTNAILQVFLHQHMDLWNKAIYIQKFNMTKLTDEDMDFMKKYAEIVSMTMNPSVPQDKTNLRKELIHAIIRSALIGLCMLLENRMAESESIKTGSPSIFHDFLNMLTEEEVKHRTVKYYADKLFITPKYLTIICKRSSDKTATQWIQEYLIENIRYYIMSTDKSMKEIADILEFPNTSFFGRYVKEHFDTTPMELRRQKKTF